MTGTVYNLIYTATGRNVSISFEPIPEIIAGHHVVETADRNGSWNESTLVYEPYPETNFIASDIFFKRFTDSELGRIITAAETNINIKILIKKLDSEKAFDLLAQKTIDAIETLYTENLLDGESRKAVLLA